MPINHAFQSPQADNGAADEVGPSEWNAAHVCPNFIVTLSTLYGQVNWSNMPAALTEFNSNVRARIKLDLTNATEVRMSASLSTSGAINAELRLQYSHDQASWAYLDGSDGSQKNDGPGASINGEGCRVSPWRTITPDARADVFIRMVGIHGDGVLDPVFGTITMQLQ